MFPQIALQYADPELTLCDISGKTIYEALTN